MARTRSIDHARYAKLGFLLGLALFAIGGGGEIVAHSLYGSIPTWEDALLFDIEVIGLLVGFFSPFVFGIALPLIE
ncbi:MAG TPA: hypothetical protein VKA37_05450 [Halobacteriales archaeon]|nr:hypothetical protein [Halobacteriales archaeon]